MFDKSSRVRPRALVYALACLLFIAAAIVPGAVSSYEEPKILVSVSGPSRAVDCGRKVTLTATVLSTDGGKPIDHQIVHWKIAQGSSADSINKTQSTTNRKGKANVRLSIGQAVGARRVTATAASVPGSVTVKVRCDIPEPTPSPRPTQRPERTTAPTVPPPLERSDLRVGYREPDLSGRAPFLIAQELGLFEAAGFGPVELTETPDGIGALLDDTIDIAVVSLKQTAEAMAAGVPIMIIGGYHGYRTDLVAVRSDIQDAAGLTGQQIILGDPADAPARLATLRDAGWDLDGVDVTVVLPEGGPDAWAASLLDGTVAMAPIENRHRLAAMRAGAVLLVDRQRYGDDVLVVRLDLLEAAPETVGAFQVAYVTALQSMTDPAHDSDLLSAAKSAGIDVTDAIKAGWANDLEDFRSWDGGVGSSSEGAGLAELQGYFLETVGRVPPIADGLAWPGLNAAQAIAGIERNPALPTLDPPGDTDLVIGHPTAALVDRAPLLLASSSGAFSRAGFEEVAPGETADGIADVQDGTLDVAVVTAAQASDALAAGAGISIIAGYAAADGSTAEPSVLIVSDVRARDDQATVAAFLQAYLRGLAEVSRPDALAAAAAEAGEAVSDESTAAWATVSDRYAPFDGSQGLIEPAVAGVDLSALDAARASLGMLRSDAAQVANEANRVFRGS